MPATSQLDWLISMTAMIVLFWSRATRDLLKACPGAGRGRSVGASLALHRLDTATKLPFLAARPIASLGPAVEERPFIDLLTGQVHALVKERHRSREFIEFLTLLDAAYPADTAIELILDNHSAHVSCETTGWLAAQPIGRFTFTFTPTHGSWLNIIEGFFSKLARSVLRHIRVSSKDELTQRLMAFVNDINREPVVHTWRYKIDDAA